MEIIRKKIGLEAFKSRIPSLLETIEDYDEITGSWGKIPKNVGFLGMYMKYGTLMRLYYTLYRVITKSVYYEYDLQKKKWLKINLTWNEVFEKRSIITYKLELDESGVDRDIIGITDVEGLLTFYDEIKVLTNGSSYTGFDIIREIHKIIGKIEIPKFKQCSVCGEKKVTKDTACSENECNGTLNEITQPIYVPSFIYRTEVPVYIELLENLKKETNNCCEIKKYEEHGGDAFLEYLKDINETDIIIHQSESSTTIDIPILLTTKLLDLGQYQVYNVDTIIDGETENSTPIETDNLIVKTTGESKLRTLRKRKKTIDDNGTELPGIIDESELTTNKTNTLQSPYQIGYIKNVQTLNNVFYGDLIVDMKETSESIEQVKESYDIIVETFTEYGFKDKILTGTANSKIPGLTTAVKKTKSYGGNKQLSYDEVIDFCNIDSYEHEVKIKQELLTMLNNKFPDILCMSQEYVITYNLTYYETEDTELVKKSETIKKEGIVCVMYNNTKIEITYALGARLKIDKNNILAIDEPSPFNSGNIWDGDGIWYRETFPLKKMCMDRFTINGTEYPFVFDVIDFRSKETTYSFEGIDFPRKNYILCEDVRYRSDTYKNDATNDPIFKNEKMTGINYPLKEEYDVLIDRGKSAAFEKHLQLSEVKTWNDLENYRNGMFLNK